ncbi:hypothetical protein SUGI_1015200 [Cryptomeria japonica]|uniref:pectinesterase n=1 Tax=Cryptomeria japonica TaxID=3369 RepID=UPI0024148575|nr:pectinesterase [Cryptomeria japonica]GLJ48082.1 hypothetical protein SUGI_1015200 [Cryptomeria japonica]
MATNSIDLHLQTEESRFSITKSFFLAWALMAMFFMPGEGKIEKTVDPKNGVILSLQAAMEEVQKAQAWALEFSGNVTGTHDQMALQDCLQLFEDTLYRLNGSLNSMKSFNLEKRSAMADVHTWVSAALTNQDLCLDGLSGTNYNRENNGSFDLTEFGSSISLQVLNLSRLISDSLALFANLRASSLARPGKRRLLSNGKKIGFPEWVSGDQRRRFLQSTADVVVAQDGSGDYKTITEALSAYNVPPQGNETYYVMYIKAGQYYESIVINRAVRNLMMIGDGMNRTCVMGNRSIGDSGTLFGSSTFAVWGDGFIAKDMTFTNTAGPQKGQAVALLVAADRSVFYRCSMEGYQDTLFLYSTRQFLRECYIYGTIDFIFGNSAAVIQKSTILVRKPLTGQENVVTAQGRRYSNQNTGTILHACTIMAASDLVPVQRDFTTYMGRPWQPFSRTVVMQSTLGDLIDPAGWVEWNSTDVFLNTLFYGEFDNDGAGADTSRRVKWPGYHVINQTAEAEQFTVGNFIDGDSWIPSSGIPFDLNIS